MFPKFDFLFNLGLVLACAYVGLVLGNVVLHFTLTILGV